ncbi:MAG: glycosyltransferase family 2 protein [Candidatus Hydrogenedentes bacterium]|nr:glycosyltransferase family 2 protein [Candidatus Hydrogenedentota bacterium]
MNTPLVFVIVINWNGRQHLEACFASLLDAAWENAVYLLVDNASTDGSVAFVEERFGPDPRVRVLALSENRGWSGGNNAGIEAALMAGADYIFLLNNDTATAPEAIPVLVERMEGNPALGALAPRMLMFDQPEILNSTGLRLSIVGAAWDIGIGRFDGPRWRADGPVAGVCGGAMFLRAAAVRDAGLLPEDFEIYLDDLDLCLRIWNAGWRIEQCAGAVVRHKYSATMGAGRQARRKYYLNTRNRFRIVLRHFPARALLLALACIAVGEARAMGRAAQSGALWRIPAHLRAWGAALAYWPIARRFRKSRVGTGAAAFWPLVARRPWFCPELMLPRDGWYPPVVWRGAVVRPIAPRAEVEVPAGALQVLLVNCYPAAGEARVRLLQGDALIGELAASDAAEGRFAVEAGALTIIAVSTFLLEDTGATADAGAWLRLACNGVELPR